MSPKAPFIIVGAVNLIVMLGGIWLRARERVGGKNGNHAALNLVALRIDTKKPHRFNMPARLLACIAMEADNRSCFNIGN